MRNSSTLYAIDGLFRILSSFTQPLPPTPPTPATFYKVSVSPGDGGTVSQSALYVKEGGSVTLSARPDYGYKFLKWDDDETDNPRTITNIQDNITLAAVFKEKIPPTPPTEPDYLCFTAEKAGATLRIVGAVTGDCTLTIPSFEYSTDDGATWNTWNFTNGEPNESGDYERISDTLTFAEIGDKVLVRGNCPDGTAGGEPVLDNGEPGMVHYFAGGEDTEAEDNVFAVGGDLQTLVDGTGATKTAPCFAMLFMREMGITITSAPKLTATKLSSASYTYLFGEQLYLTTPAEMGALTNASLPNVNIETAEGLYAMAFMYAETGITSMPDVPGIVLDKNSTYQDFINVQSALHNLVVGCEDVLVTSDNGRTFNGFTGIDLSYDALENYRTLLEADEISAIMVSLGFFGNINGFYVALVDKLSNDENMGEVITSDGYVPFDDTRAFWIEDGVSKDITLTASSHGGYQFSKWQTKSSESDEWTDDAEHLTSTLTFTAEPDEQYYYKAVFEAESQSQGE
jgi:hypothetical protein